ncbi:MAG: sulfate reduction electron transfer complex DsrMKJOP subunit DsrM [Acidobacteriota bacterium]
MKFLLALVLVTALGLLAAAGTGLLGLYGLFAVWIPYAAILIFVVGMVTRVIRWARSPVPFRIPVTCGQQKSLPWIRTNPLDNPHNGWGAVGRMALEVLLFRSLFRNTRAAVLSKQRRIVFGPDKWLWFGALAFHWALLVILLRHLRLFTAPVPGWVVGLESLDGFFQVGVPVFFASTVVFLAAGTFLLMRRLLSPQLRYISILGDYFAVVLLLGIGSTGFFLRHILKTDVSAVKELAVGLVHFSPVVTPDLHWLFYTHLFLVSVLFAYFPFSKLVHLGGIFLSPTRNLVNNNRAKRHVNPWDAPVPVHTYQEYEEEFRDKMVAAGIPVEGK